MKNAKARAADNARERSRPLGLQRHQFIARRAQAMCSATRSCRRACAANREFAASAATVCERSPPASCSKMMLPSRRCCLTRCRMMIGAGLGPILRIDILEHDEITEILRDLQAAPARLFATDSCRPRRADGTTSSRVRLWSRSTTASHSIPAECAPASRARDSDGSRCDCRSRAPLRRSA